MIKKRMVLLLGMLMCFAAAGAMAETRFGVRRLDLREHLAQRARQLRVRNHPELTRQRLQECDERIDLLGCELSLQLHVPHDGHGVVQCGR